MTADLFSLDIFHREAACYFSIPTAAHFSLETPLTTPTSDYQQPTPSLPSHPLLACRPSPPLSMSSPFDASRLLQLQTQAAYRPLAEPLQPRASSTSSTDSSASSDSSTSVRKMSSSSSPPCCCRCRREGYGNMFQIGTNRYYCSHCAKMTGYSAS